MSVCKKVILSIAVIAVFSQLCFASKTEVFVDSQRTRVLLSEEYTYYGLDFSIFRLINGAKMGDGEKITNYYLAEWTAKFDNKNSERKLKSSLDVQTLNDERFPFQSDQCLKNNSSTIISSWSSVMSIDSIERVVKGYRLSKNDGIGVSMIVTEFNKPNEEVIAYITFFDIETLELLYVIKCKEKANGYGMIDHWINGVESAWHDFFYMPFKYEKRDARKSAKKGKGI